MIVVEAGRPSVRVARPLRPRGLRLGRADAGEKERAKEQFLAGGHFEGSFGVGASDNRQIGEPRPGNLSRNAFFVPARVRHFARYKRLHFSRRPSAEAGIMAAFLPDTGL